MNKKVKQIVLPLLAAFIWGSAFVAQKGGAEVLGALSFNWTRSLTAAICLLILVLLLEKRSKPEEKSPEDVKKDRRALFEAGLVVGTILAVGSTLQQYGVGLTTAGKAGFLTALYIVLVPLFGLFLGKRVRIVVWMGVGVPVFNSGDLLVIACALVFALHILAIDHYTKKVDGIKLSCAQFFVAGFELLIAALIVEGFPLSDIADCIPFILYTGVLSSGVGYTLQILSQKDGDPAVVSLLLSLESFFAAVSGAVVLGERLSLREYLGCALMLCAVILVQLPDKKKASSKR